MSAAGDTPPLRCASWISLLGLASWILLTLVVESAAEAAEWLAPIDQADMFGGRSFRCDIRQEVRDTPQRFYQRLENQVHRRVAGDYEARARADRDQPALYRRTWSETACSTPMLGLCSDRRHCLVAGLVARYQSTFLLAAVPVKAFRADAGVPAPLGC